MYENISREKVNDRIGIYASNIEWSDRTMWDVAHEFYHHGFEDGRDDLRIEIKSMLDKRGVSEKIAEEFIEANKEALDRLAEN